MAAAINDSFISLHGASSETLVGWRDVASAARLTLPGRCIIRKFHGKVLCFDLNKRAFAISSSVLSPNNFVRGPLPRLVHRYNNQEDQIYMNSASEGEILNALLRLISK